MKEKIGWGGAMRRLVEKLEEDKIKTGKIMKVNPAVANKMLKRITEEYEALKVKEAHSKDFLASVNENPDSIRPKYDFNKTQSELYDYEEKIRKIKHALNKFNVNTLIPEFGINIDEMLVLIPQLTKQKAKLGAMKDRLPKMREKVVGYGANGVIDYRYINYDIDEVQKEYQLVSEKLTKAQLALDNINTSIEFELDI
jgi:DNA-binding Lrp family transcriptional regulator